ncbi:polysaccharide biosynthesis protein [Tardiphaga alba]|uniref:Polysaccharide biosynthesis protein n=1 Tax=Tardiphaga alba TaxID=340268 RepID=A0ABX8A8D8_9BRAD|nr:polysaccharide biosynthesis C-terminal domain-containing protein [Tardiphaga alba]QUS38550.1 polysaccharide biosynthesis protein [Tardiphaga alba]
MSLVKQTSVYFAANAASAAFGLLNVVIFTRLMTPAEYGIYIIGTALAAIIGAILFTWLRQAIARHEAKADGTDMRATVIAGFLCISLPLPLVVLAAAHFSAYDLKAVPAGIVFALCVGFYELSIELLRARQQTHHVLYATLGRAVLVTLLGCGVLYVGGDGRALLLSGGVAYTLAALLVSREVWGRTKIDFSQTRLWHFIAWGMPLTFSIGLLALATSTDRFIVAYLAGSGAAGQYGASVDLARQALIIPAISAASAFVPIAVKLLANEGKEAVQTHLKSCLELLLAITLPCCIGFAMLAPRISNLVLGEEFRAVGASIIPIVSIAVIFQIFVQQYLHISFFLSSQNRFYLINAVVTFVLGTILSYFLIDAFGVHGAAWGRVASEIISLLSALWLVRSAFTLPFPLMKSAKVGLAVGAMAVTIAIIDPLFRDWDRIAVAVLVPFGAVIYLAACWVLDVADIRGKAMRAIVRFRSRFAPQD